MADTDFANLPASATIAPTDSILLVRNGAAYRFTGTLLAIDAAGNVGFGTTAPGAKIESVTSAAGPSGWSVPAQLTSSQYPLLRWWSVSPNKYGSIGFGDGYLQFFVNGTASTVGIQAFGLDAAGNVVPGADNARSLGIAGFRWSNIYGATGQVSTSDARAKQQIGPMPDAWLDAWADVEWVRYRFNDAVEEKGDDARWHVGLVAQQVRDAFAARDLDALAIGLLCYDEWAATPAVKAVTEKRNKNGEVTRVARLAVPAIPAGDRWGLRYDECQAIEAAYQRRRLTRIEEQLARMI